VTPATRLALVGSPEPEESPRYAARGPAQLSRIAAQYGLDPDIEETVRLLSLVLPFRVSQYVLDELVDWSRVPDDPIFQLVFPQDGMLRPEHVSALRAVAPRGQRAGAGLAEVVRGIRAELNPHPAEQLAANVPTDERGRPIEGLQHKYAETVLYFPSHGQTCHAYCAYCFRWAQFVGDDDLRFAAHSPHDLVRYLHRHPRVSDVLLTGGDPMIMSTARLAGHLEPVLGVESVRTVRIGTKSLAYWPQRFVGDRDADDLLRLLERVVASGRTLAVMAHVSHPRELEGDVARQAVERIRATGAVVYCQAPLMRRVNDDAALWRAMWAEELAQGMVPYYMFVARDTGAQDYYKVPLVRAWQVWRDAWSGLSGLSRTVRGPVMSATPGKVAVDGVASFDGEPVLALRLLQARDPDLVGRPFWAHQSPTAAWVDELAPHRFSDPDIVRAVWGATPRPRP
jgi:L-lysine 2,3-aminomutase